MSTNHTTLPSQIPQSPEEDERKIFLVGLSKDHGVDELTTFFSSKYPSFMKVEMKKKNKKSGKIAGYGFLSVSSDEDYAAIVRKGKFYLFGRGFFAKPYLKGENLKRFKQTVNQRRVFMFGLPSPLTDSQLEDTLRDVFGNLECAFLVENNHTKINGKGLGYATFNTVESAKEATDIGEFEIHGKMVKIVPYNKREAGKKSEGLYYFGCQLPPMNYEMRDPYQCFRDESQYEGFKPRLLSLNTPPFFPSSPNEENRRREFQGKSFKNPLMHLTGNCQKWDNLPYEDFLLQKLKKLKIKEAILLASERLEHEGNNLRHNISKKYDIKELYKQKICGHEIIIRDTQKGFDREVRMNKKYF